MNLPAALFVIRWLVWDTFRQSLASRVFWLVLGLSGVVILLCLSLRIEGPESLRGDTELVVDNKPVTGTPNVTRVSLAFGAFRTTLPRDKEDAVRFVEGAIALLASSPVGTLLLLVFTAGFLPEFLQPSAASVLLVKPLPRWSLLVGKYLGVLAFVAFQAVVFFGGTWLALGLTTGMWLPAYLFCIPVLVLHFAIVYSASALLAVLTRSTVAGVLGAIVFSLICAGMNYGYYTVLTLPSMAPEIGPLPDSFRWLVEVGYWLLPKPVDLLWQLRQAVGAQEHFFQDPVLAEAQRLEVFPMRHPELSLLTSVLSTVALLAIAARQFNTTEY
jgi:ABC-type transport system involved in multi-copper enzyme maturation permease subunit